MAFGDFTFPRVQTDLGLTLREAHLFSAVAPVAPGEFFAEMIAYGANMALAINTEKAKSEFIIAPILLQVRRFLKGTCAIFSGIELNVDSSQGLNGICDFIVSGSPLQSVMGPPLMTIVEAKNDNLRNGLGQCIASMVAADLFNQKEGSPIEVIHGVVTIGSAWKFLRLEKSILILDIEEYPIHELGKILGILTAIVRARGAAAGTTTLPSAP